ncbi:FAD dependent oxidoreductase [Parapedobacter composti]|uniref:FAD dependent oxidoreductase n=1 Tax=Parapedobacter composti TaxID=623281 RepID=A0A1I1IFA5_9SPHI|nr:FAD-dependent oxidoreductase [Parapedobacter composti]SFC32413.1 FAD dependent oxidoreductase [Parapedobacter composti]
MKIKLTLIFLAITPWLVVAEELNYDVCIYGGTSAGVIAAYQVAKMNKSVVIIAPDDHIGGLSSGGLGQTDIGNKHAIGGLSREFYRQLGTYYGTPEAWKFEPSAAAQLFDRYIKEMGIPVIKGQRISKVMKKNARITDVILVPTYGKRPTQRLSASVFIDCTYEGDLMAMAGVSYTVGREDNSQYNETLNGYQLPEYLKQSGRHQFPDGVSPYKIPGDPKSGLLWGIGNGKPAAVGTGDNRVQAYNFRICLTDSAANRIPITRPEGYDSTKYELLARLIEAQPTLRKVNDYFIWSRMPNRKTDINNRGGFSTDMIGENYNWPEADFHQRRKIFNEHLAYTKGLLYFMASDPRVPESIRQFVQQWGYPKDEYPDNGNFTPQLYIREGRRMVGEYVMTEHNCRGKAVVADPIGMAAYTMDSHNTQRLVVNGMVKNEGNVEVKGFRPYPIAYRSITPKQRECTNLLVPVSLSASHIAFGSIRMEPVFMILGQSAAIAAVQAIDQKTSVQQIDYQRLREQLLQHGQILSL